MKLKDLFFAEEYTPVSCSPDVCETEISAIVCDSLRVIPGCLFVCIKGTKTNSHSLLPHVFACGAALAVIDEDEVDGLPQGCPCIAVPSTRQALAFAWSRFCGSPQESLIMIGVTGTNGKTSTATMLAACLRAAGYKTALIGTTGTYIDVEKQEEHDVRQTTMTTPDPDLLYPFLTEAKRRGVTHVVMEVSSHALALGKVAPIRFTEAIFTNLSPEHLDFHRDMSAYGKAKELLFQGAAHATVNCDDTYGAALASRLCCPVTTCGCIWEGDARVTDVQGTPEGISYFLRYKDIRTIVHMQIPGAFTVYNSVLAAISAISLGVKPTVAFGALEHIKTVPGRMEFVGSSWDNVRVYIDYAHTEKALESLLLCAKRMGGGKIILVFGCGGDRDKSKRAPMGRAAARGADYTIITSDNSRGEDSAAIIKDILEGHTEKEKRRVIVDREKAIRHAVIMAAPGDLVLLTGKGHERYEIKKDGITPFDERKIALDALSARKKGHTMEDTAPHEN